MILMRYFFNEWPKVKTKLLRKRHILLCVDFDGTVTPIKPKPKQAILAKKTRRLLDNISKHKAFTLAVVSGRSLKDVRKKVALPGVVLSGNHGLEIQYKNKNFIHPQAKKFIPLIKRQGELLRERIRGFKGVVLEEKGLSLSLHYRLLSAKKVPALRRIFLEVASAYLKKGKVKVTKGKKILELRPNINWHKGKAVRYLQKKLKISGSSLIYIGDDVTDEDAFSAVNKVGGLSIVVGKKRNSQAKYYLNSHIQIQKFLNALKDMKK